MSIQIIKVTIPQYSKAVENINLPLWANPLYITCYKDKLLLIAKKKSEIKGVWVIPLHKNKIQLLAERDFRLFPYSSPIIFETDNLKRRKIVFNFFEFIKSYAQGVSLPMDIDFIDIPCIQGLGAFVEWRHTHIINEKIEIKNLGNRLNNHINHASKFVEIVVTRDPNLFNFEVAIKGTIEEKNVRGNLAKKLLKNKNAIVINASENSTACAGLLLAYDNKTAYLMHSWQLPETRRGTISLLVTQAINWTFNNNLSRFDFEGSVIQDIDYFFCGFNAKITPYAHIHWNSKRELLFKQIEDAINIPGRIIVNENQN